MTEEREELARLTRELLERAKHSVDEDWDWTGLAAAQTAPSVPVAPTADDREGRLADLAAEIHACRKCPLGAKRLRACPGVGSARARVMFIGEGPGYEEDHRGEPFVGKAGQLLDKIIASIGLSRQTVYIANIVKCHPMVDPDNPELRGNDRPPSQEEIAACRPYLDRQIEVIQPDVIVTLGNVPARVLLGTTAGITTLRGKWREYSTGMGARPIRLLPTYHPAALLRNPNLKKDVWEDMKALKKELERAA